MEKGLHLPVGDDEHLLKMEVGITTRNFVPTNVFYWKDVKDEDKVPMFQKIQDEFDISLDDPHAKKVIDKMMTRRFMTFKHKCHKHFKKFTSSEEAQANPPSDVKIDDWKNMCKHFESDRFQGQSKANKNNREQMRIPHTSGSKSFVQRIYELKNNQENIENHSEESNVEPVEHVEPVEIKLYYDAHHKKDGTWVNQQAEENYEKMRTILSEEIEEGIEVNGRQILEKVLNSKCGYTRGLGYGVKKRSSKELELQSALDAERVGNEKRTQELVVQLQSQNEKILDQSATINELKENQNVFQSQIQQLLAKFGRDTSP
ncbi:hypothetical protein V6N12_012972 [Hibiscus sabdariffa]|uniref:Transposase n=1 Tax=Hibiscus sabdariffa TaxID=183260 RepID=A0ABR2EG02_9ROSI